MVARCVCRKTLGIQTIEAAHRYSHDTGNTGKVWWLRLAHLKSGWSKTWSGAPEMVIPAGTPGQEYIQSENLPPRVLENQSS